MTSALATAGPQRTVGTPRQLRVWYFQQLLWKPWPFSANVNFPLRWCCTQVLHVVNHFRFLWVSFCSNFRLGAVEFMHVRRHQGRVTLDVTIIHVPQVRQASIFLQSMSWIVSSGEFFRSNQLKIGDSLHPDCVFSLQGAACLRGRQLQSTEGCLDACWASTRPRVSATTSPRAELHLRRPSASPCSAPRSLGIGDTRPVQRGTSSDVSTPPLQCAWEENGTLLRALPSTLSFRSSFFFVDFGSGK